MTTISPPLAAPATAGLVLNPEGHGVWRVVWQEHRWPILLAVIHAGAGLVLAALGLLPVRQPLLWRTRGYEPMLLAFLSPLPLLLLLDLARRRSLAATQQRYLTLRTVLGMLIVLLFVAQESQMHEAFKRFIGRPENPFRWDAALSHLSIALHGGRPAWRWLDPVFRSVPITAALDLAYVLWFPVIFYLGCLVAWLPDRVLRARALAAWGLLWVGLGTGMAQVFSSAGPVYYHHVVPGADPYQPLLAHLAAVHQQVPLMAVQLHEAIWANLQRVHDYPWLHISAFPSMHVALPCLFTLIGWRVWRPFGVLLGAYTLIILCGSIYLGWHYAIDGYASILGVLGCWWLAGRLLHWHGRKPGHQTAAPVSE